MSCVLQTHRGAGGDENDQQQQSFTALLDRWMGENVQHRHGWPGIATYRLHEGTPRFTLGEVVDQVSATRQRRAGNISQDVVWRMAGG